MVTFDFMLPYYGDVQLMQDAVRSVLAQTDRDFRLVVIDDGKEPDVPGWFAGLGDDRVHYTRNEQNLGITKNFQKCVRLSEADYVVIMGCDDVLHPHYLETVRGIVEAQPGIGMVQPGVEVIDGTGRVTQGLADNTKKRLYAPQVKGCRLMGGEELAASVLRGNWLYFPSIAWRGEVLRKVNFRDDYSVIQDLALVIDLLEGGEQMVIDNTTTVFQYRRHAVSESSVQAFSGTRFAEAERYFSAVAARMDARGWPKAARAARFHSASRLHALTMLPGALRSGNKAGARTLAKHAFTSGQN
ncbi:MULTISPECIES: glycosyltransferase family 2 protein [Streptomyces]|uniref:Glycosyltransferase 2-like domain-containing protein n=1 Tax=Streptomyces virginiae TaxID=1961 RepID=A0ABQ3NCT5_STRVG|nr:MULTISPECIES: glycosyltransferase family 2 protein [Streptomyces]KOU17468.1 glycosyl transferase family 2 [Streptomyces sp. WM6349]KOU86535.1 glycosyl transferase family 2 [Streptomyces sp. XY593]KOU97809.1 glycosyl transferase family 2 [Streptomyces sp. XY533]KOV01971.1 glycosyl transferase family 2 [Streptomyces sp. XY511]KOV43723.1 glycosyl transferase family 2 [Streptomyces sp. H036]